jgi:TPR repeat protein
MLAGAGVAKDERAVFELIRSAAEAGHLDAEATLAAMYFDGKQTKRDYAAALHWAQAPGEAGNSLAQTTLGFIYHFGLGFTIREATSSSRPL